MKIDKAFLRREYVQAKKTSEQIGKELGLTGRAVRYHLTKHGFGPIMAERRRTVGLGKEPANKGKPGLAPPNKGKRIKDPKAGRYFVDFNGHRTTRARMVMALHLGRPLTNSEVVHHKDENPLNDSIENLELLPSQAAHIKHHNPVLKRWHRSR